MSRWEDRLETSDAKAAIGALEDELGQIAGAVPAEQEAELSRLQRVLAAAKVRMEETDPEMLSPGMLANLHSHINAVRANVQQQINRPTPETPVDLTAANNAADGMLDMLGTWPALPETGQGREMAGLVRQLKKDNTATIKALREEVAALQKSLKQAEEQTTGLVGARDTTLSQLDTKVTELSTTIDEQKTRLEVALQEQGQRFDASQDEHRREYATDVEAFKTQAKEVLAEQQTAYVESSKTTMHSPPYT
jgi:molybdopterin converting factor small subunit